MSIFDKFFNAKEKLQPAIEPELNDAVPGGSGGKILSEDITRKLAERHQKIMSMVKGGSGTNTEDGNTNNNNNHNKQQDAASASSAPPPPHVPHRIGDEVKDSELEVEEKLSASDNDDDDNDDDDKLVNNDAPVAAGDQDEDENEDEDDDDIPEDEGTSLFTMAIARSDSSTMMMNNNNNNDGSSTSTSNWNKKGDAGNDFLVFGSAKANAIKGAVNTSKAVELSEADHYMSRVCGFTFVAGDSKNNGEDAFFRINSEKNYSGGNNNNSSGSASPEMVSVDVSVPLWAAHRFTPRSLMTKEDKEQKQQEQDAEITATQEENVKMIMKDTPLKKQLLSTNPVNKREAAAIRTYFSGYSPIDSVALHQEILDFYDWIRPTEAELCLRTLIERQVKNIATALFPGCDPVIYGSLSTGLLLPWSDLDMSVLDVTNSTIEDGLLALSKQISLNGMCEGHAPQVILKTKVPLIKFESSIAPIDVDVSINAADGKQNSEWISKMLMKFPESKYLIILIKYFLHQRDLNEPYRGGVGSFAATLMVLSFLQHHPIYTTECPNRASYGLGRLFVDFLQYYSTLGFNPEKIGISLRLSKSDSSNSEQSNANNMKDLIAQNGGCCYFQRDSPGTLKCRKPAFPGKGPTKMDIEDPVTLDNNAASSVRLIQMVMSSFEGAFLLLTARAPALNSMLAPAHFYPQREQLYQPPDLIRNNTELSKLFGETINPVNDHVTKRPTLLSRIIHHDVALVAKRIATQETFDRFKRDQLSKEAQLFHEVLRNITKIKGYSTQVEIKTRHRYDEPAKNNTSNNENTNNKKPSSSSFHHKVVPHSPFAMGYNQQLHEEYFKEKVFEMVKDHKSSLGALAKAQVSPYAKNAGRNSNNKVQTVTTTTTNKTDSVRDGPQRRQREQQHDNNYNNSQESEAPRKKKYEQPSTSNNKPNQYQQQRAQHQQSNNHNNKSNHNQKRYDDDSDDDDGGNFGSWQGAY